MTFCDPQMSKRPGNYADAFLTVCYQLLILPENFKCIFSDSFFACVLLPVQAEAGRGSVAEISRLDKIAHIPEEN